MPKKKIRKKKYYVRNAGVTATFSMSLVLFLIGLLALSLFLAILMALIRSAWGLDQPNGPLPYLASGLPQFDLNELGTLYPALSS